ncbi:unnamed protein product [Clonostachys rosea f. rosea IK726]|uniref:Transcription factor domain-containing protein n=2 Tax=Bionectria ochroleuca TaxID=29856 RepID=A0A0B7KED7_BIOOC|nr:unnamed protein product [Clonostachys rosea f. rosea IK726]
MSFVIRVLQSWPRMMAGLVGARFPPIIHHLQVAQGLPLPLAQCSTLLKTWMACDDSGRALVHDLIKLEVKRLLQQYQSYTGTDLLAATQSLLLLAIVLLFGSNKAPAVSPWEGAQILVEMWDVKHRLANTGMFIKEEIDHVLPMWEDWAIVSAKRRTILALHHIEWVWSLLQGYPILTCFELAPLPAPSAGYLWSKIDEASWKRQYVDWLAQWKDGGYKMGELFNIKHGESLEARSEMWLAEVDEFGMLLMSEINAVSCIE